MLAIPGERDGVNAEYCVHDASMCYKLPDNMTTLEGAMIEPLAVGMHGTELSNAKLGETAIVLGSGCIGLCTVMSLKARGVSEIYVADVMDKRLEKALEVGATRVFNSQRESIEEFAKTLPGGGVDQVYECAGNRVTTLQSCRLIRRGGKVTLTGVSPEPVLELDIATLNAMEGTLYSVYRYRNLWPKAIAAVSSGLIPLKNIVSHEFDFKDCIEAIDYSLNHKDEVIKAVFLASLIGIVLGGINGFFIAYFKVTPFIVTLATMQIYKGIVYVITKGMPITGMPEAAESLANGVIGGILPNIVIVMIVICLLLTLMLKRTKLGRYIYALGGNRNCAKIVGIPTVHCLARDVFVRG